MVEIPQLGGIHRTRPGINRIYTLLTFGQNSRHSLLWKNQIITFLDMSQRISIVCFICKWWRWYLSLCWLNIVLSKLFFQMLFRQGRVQCLPNLTKQHLGCRPPRDQVWKHAKAMMSDFVSWFPIGWKKRAQYFSASLYPKKEIFNVNIKEYYLVSNWVKERRSIFPCRTITQRNIEYKY